MEAERKTRRQTNPKELTNPLSVLFFFYMIPIFRRNYKKGLTENDLFEPLDDHRSKSLGDRLEGVWKAQHRKHKKSALHRAFLKIYGLQLAIFGILQLVMEMMWVVVVPLSVGGLVSYFEKSSDVSSNDAYMYAGLIILALASDLLIISHTDLALTHMAMKLRVSCCSLIYRKALRLSRASVAQTTIGQIVNLLSNDVGKFDEGFLIVHYIWIAPVQTMVGTYLLYNMVGPTAFSGVGFLLLFIPLQIYFGKKISELRMRTALRTDERVRLMNEILSGIQVIKMYNWEKPFAKLVSFARRFEIKSIRANFFLEAITFCLEMIVTRLAVFMTIIIYTYAGNDITAETIFSIVAIYGPLRISMTLFFSYAISNIAEMYVTMSRIQKFLSYDELPSPPGLQLSSEQLLNGDSATKLAQNGINHYKTNKTPSILFTDVSAQWNSDSSDNNLNHINIDINKNQLVAVIGPVGSGKSSLFDAILKELPISNGSMSINGKISYAAQESWLFSASVRQNILFGDPYVEDRYQTVLKICALEPDLVLLPHGDKTIVGEKGKVVSGGQKARINLARCIYKQADIYLLDDPLSAVDTKVGKHLFEDCITKFLADKICVLITHQLQYLKSADKIVIMKEGKIVEEGTYESLQTSGLDFAKFLQEFNSEEEKQNEKKSDVTSRQNSEMGVNKITESDEPELVEETMQHGSITAFTYAAYLRYGGNYIAIVLLILAFIATECVGKGGDFFISEWANFEQRVTESHDNSTVDRDSFMYGYSGIMAVTVVLAACQSMFFFIFFMRASVNMHESIFARISYATMRFFNANPTGRILNRFSKDMGTIDEYLPYVMYDVMQILLGFFGMVIITSIVNPWLIFPAVGAFIVFYLFRNVYLETSRTVKRIEGLTRSPIFSHMTASMNGLSTIRAFSAQQVLIDEFDGHQDLHSSAFYLYMVSNKSFGFYLTFLGATIVSTVTISLILLGRDYYGGEAGLILTQYISITSILEWAMRGLSELENNMTSVERVLEYTKVEIEPIRKELSILPKNWPEFGKVLFQNVSMRYKPEEPPVLNNLTFEILPREKIGIVGRTGAGKSSIVAALFQLYDIEGSIFIDDIDTTQLPLEVLRSKISIIPQEPVLFSGTIRKNLDPFDQYDDESIWSALEEVELKEIVSETAGGLSSNVSEAGSNYSVGQRQLVCLARAIIRNNQILVMDEATANVDPYTDAIIQETIRKKFSSCTVITIAHRLHTIMDSERVLVIDMGKVVEFDHPYTLLQNKNSIFSTMVDTTGAAVASNLRNVAQKSYTNFKNSKA